MKTVVLEESPEQKEQPVPDPIKEDSPEELEQEVLEAPENPEEQKSDPKTEPEPKQGSPKLKQKANEFIDKLKANNPFKKFIEGLDKIDEMKEAGILEQMDDEKLFGEAEQIADEVLNKEDCENRVEMLMSSGGKVIESISRIPGEEGEEKKVEVMKPEEKFEPSTPPPQTDFMEELVKVNALTKEVSRLQEDNSDLVTKLNSKSSDLSDALSEIQLLQAEKNNLLNHYTGIEKKYETLHEEWASMKEEYDFMKIENESIHKDPYALPQGSNKQVIEKKRYKQLKQTERTVKMLLR